MKHSILIAHFITLAVFVFVVFLMLRWAAETLPVIPDFTPN